MWGGGGWGGGGERERAVVNTVHIRIEVLEYNRWEDIN